MPTEGGLPGSRASLRPDGRTPATASTNDIEDPLLDDPGSPMGTDSSSHQGSPPILVPSTHVSKPWPTLRMSSLSTRRLSPQHPDFDQVRIRLEW